MSLKRFVARAIAGLVLFAIVGYAIIFMLSIDSFVWNELGGNSSNTTSMEIGVTAMLTLGYVVWLAFSVRRYLGQRTHRHLGQEQEMQPSVATTSSLSSTKVKNQMVNEKILDKAAKVALYSHNDKGEPASYKGSYGQLILTSQRLVFIKAKISLRVQDFTADINESLKTMEGSFAVPLNEIEEADVVKKRIAMNKFAFLRVKYKNGDMNCFSTSGPHQEKDTDSFCSMINRMLTRAEVTPVPADSILSSPTSRLNQPLEADQKSVEQSAGAASNEAFLFCPDCGKQLPISRKFCPFCGYAFRQVVSPPSPQKSGIAPQPQTQAPKAITTLKVSPTKPPRFISHSPAINNIIFILRHHKIEITYQLGGVGHYDSVTIVDDDLMITPSEIPSEIAAAAKKWDETTVINWLAPHIPRAIAKAKADPQAGIA